MHLAREQCSPTKLHIGAVDGDGDVLALCDFDIRDPDAAADCAFSIF